MSIAPNNVQTKQVKSAESLCQEKSIPNVQSSQDDGVTNLIHTLPCFQQFD